MTETNTDDPIVQDEATLKADVENETKAKEPKKPKAAQKRSAKADVESEAFPPRVVDGNDRAGPGEMRFKVRCSNYGPRSTVYIIAADEKSARACYTQTQGLDEEHAKLVANGVENPEPPLLAVTVLPD